MLVFLLPTFAICFEHMYTLSRSCRNEKQFPLGDQQSDSVSDSDSDSGVTASLMNTGDLARSFKLQVLALVWIFFYIKKKPFQDVS